MIIMGICVLITMIMIALRIRYYDIRFRGKTFWVCNDTTGEIGKPFNGIGNIVFSSSKNHAETITINGVVENNVYCCNRDTIICKPYILKVSKENKVYRITSDQFEGIAWYNDMDGFNKYKGE